MTYPKRLIEVDLPIARISAHARREKSIRHGHISTLHIWWARRPLAACRAVICASLWPDPEDLTAWLNENATEGSMGQEIRAPRGCRATEGVLIRPRRFLDEARKQMRRWAERHAGHKGVSEESFGRLVAIQKDSALLDDPVELRRVLLDFIADFANWDNSTNTAFLDTARALTQAAHEALGGEPGTRPLVVDPFAGGGSIPLEALRVGADAFASDLNPVAVLLNKIVLEYIPKYGQELADEVRKWGQWVKEQAEKELAEFYPKDPDGATPIAYLWARTVLSEAPGAGEIPVEVPLMRSLWLAKKASRKRALRWVRNAQGKVKTKTIEVTHVEDGQPLAKRVKRPLLEIFEPAKDSEVEGGTVARGSATCPVTGFTTKVDSVRAQLKQRRGGAADARLFCVVTTRARVQGRFYRLPTKADQAALDAAAAELERRERADGTERSQQGRAAGRRSAAAGAEGAANRRSLVPDEVISLNELRRISVPIYGMERWGDLFSPRQALALTTLARLVRELPKVWNTPNASDDPGGLAKAVQTCLALAVTKHADANCANCTWRPSSLDIGHLFGRQAIGMVWDFAEVNPTSGATRDFWNGVEGVLKALESTDAELSCPGNVEQSSATVHSLPDDAAAAWVTDPPYYDAVPYAYLSDFFYVWMRRTLADVHPALFGDASVPKDAEIVVDRPHKLSKSTKDIAFYERELTRAFAEGRRVLAPSGVGTIVFASKTTASWEAILKAVIDAGFVVTGSWPIDTEMATRVAAQGQARLASSVHIVCRPRENPDGTVSTDDVGDWRDVLTELPKRIHEWMPRLAEEGVVGADAIFACLGPALQIFSQYSRVERASGEQIRLKEYLEEVWAAVANKALDMIFKDADTSGFEADARLTVIWFWVLKVANGNGNGNGMENGREPGDNASSDSVANEDRLGFVMEFDAARLLAQGMGTEISELAGPGGIIAIRSGTATLVHLRQRETTLLGEQLWLIDDTPLPQRGRSPREKNAKLKAVGTRGHDLFDPDPPPEIDPAQPYLPGLKPPSDKRTLLERLDEKGNTMLDRLHQAMLLFGRGHSGLLRIFLTESGVAQNPLFWQLAQALSALYPRGSDEKRWVDGVLGRKKGLGL